MESYEDHDSLFSEENLRVLLTLFFGLAVGFGAQDLLSSYFVICHCPGFSSCTDLDLFIIRK